MLCPYSLNSPLFPVFSGVLCFQTRAIYTIWYQQMHTMLLKLLCIHTELLHSFWLLSIHKLYMINDLCTIRIYIIMVPTNAHKDIEISLYTQCVLCIWTNFNILVYTCGYHYCVHSNNARIMDHTQFTSFIRCHVSELYIPSIYSTTWS
jgi:hypothetical protein